MRWTREADEAEKLQHEQKQTACKKTWHLKRGGKEGSMKREEKGACKPTNPLIVPENVYIYVYIVCTVYIKSVGL